MNNSSQKTYNQEPLIFIKCEWITTYRWAIEVFHSHQVKQYFVLAILDIADWTAVHISVACGLSLNRLFSGLVMASFLMNVVC